MCIFSFRFLFLFLILAISSVSLTVSAEEHSKFNNTIPEGNDLDVIAIIGQKVSFEENTIYPTVKETLIDGTVVERRIAAFNSRYEAKYRVIHWVTEDMGQDIIEFEVFDHYSSPQLPHISTPLVLLVNYEGRWVQSKYNNYDVSRTTDGDWAICGYPETYERAEDKGERYAQPLAFLNELKDKNGDNCKLGTRVADIFRFQNETRFLPQKWRVACNLEVGIDRNTVAGTGMAPDAEQVGLAHEACFERLKFKSGKFAD